jgi:cobaltochelatase CobN
MTGTNILYLTPRSGVWEKDDEITSVYMDSMSYAYTGDTWGEPSFISVATWAKF